MTDLGEPIMSHDAYGNPYNQAHPCHECNGTGRSEAPCHHDMGFNIVARNEGDNFYYPIALCIDCGQRWRGIPADTRIHSGMFDVLADAIRVETPESHQYARDIMNAYLDWRPAGQKQLDDERKWATVLPLLRSILQMIGNPVGIENFPATQARVAQDVLGFLVEHYSVLKETVDE